MFEIGNVVGQVVRRRCTEAGLWGLEYKAGSEVVDKRRGVVGSARASSTCRSKPTLAGDLPLPQPTSNMPSLEQAPAPATYRCTRCTKVYTRSSHLRRHEATRKFDVRSSSMADRTTQSVQMLASLHPIALSAIAVSREGASSITETSVGQLTRPQRRRPPTHQSMCSQTKPTSSAAEKTGHPSPSLR